MKINDKENDEMKDWKDADSSLLAIPKSTYDLAVLFSRKFVFIISLNGLRLVSLLDFPKFCFVLFYQCLIPVMKDKVFWPIEEYH
jgi:hypothetical protein